MESSNEQTTREVYSLVSALPRFDHRTAKQQLPANGIYLFFERGEGIHQPQGLVDRIVRVGTHHGNGNFPGRIRHHYGRRRSLGGNKNASVFRRHLGGALLRKRNREDLRLPDWSRHGAPSFVEVEAEVSQLLRDTFTYVCFRVDDAQERLVLESALIALLATYPLAEPSTDWLGHHAAAVQIRQSGLWNTLSVAASPLTPNQFPRLEALIARA